MIILRYQLLIYLTIFLLTKISFAKIRDHKDLHSDNYYSIVFNKKKDILCIAPSEGAKYKNGKAIEKEFLVSRNGGHKELVNRINLECPIFTSFSILDALKAEFLYDCVGGGFRKNSIYFISRVINGFNKKIKSEDEKLKFTKNVICSLKLKSDYIKCPKYPNEPGGHWIRLQEMNYSVFKSQIAGKKILENLVSKEENKLINCYQRIKFIIKKKEQSF